MFESTIVPAVVGNRPTEREALRAPRWDEVVARLAAVDDLRHAMTTPSAHGGNFERFGKRGEALPAREQRLVNHNDLGHGKGPGGKTLPPQMAR
ncbi:hypothetical protein [Pelagerythrobacter rhizovicinus]|uniref:Uncharacterized protein n=1 Tax=Pelagerythrobacter rhizovicinus TaxID=2268576 RepID=A0A4Q2KMW9_9SPHN|nr:hypothetical protein [Pelagerythrobacter rhizovicinus]RXZ64773.1 hypothetical protein ETX26_12980 [Pelagerythrobacter rhizovicinus]